MDARFMELELGLALPNQNPILEENIYKSGCKYVNQIKPRYADHGYDEDGDEVHSKGLSLLLWSGQPNEEDDEKLRKIHVDEGENYINEENQEIVGWPPVNSLRKEFLRDHDGGVANHHRARARVRVTAEDSVEFPVRNSIYVKVKMEGVAIGRKIDLRRCKSYQALTDTLINMFAKYAENSNRDGDYTICYQDKEGDWMLVGDIPWEIFVESARRMKILRNDN